MRAALFLIAAIAVQPALAAPAPTKSYNVFFSEGSAELTPEAATILAIAAKEIRQKRPGHVIVSAGTPETTAFAQARFQSVQSALVYGGVDAKKIVRANLTQEAADLGPVADSRVEVTLQGRQGYLATRYNP
jgi:outer membrane protein OmpA-like peptidoglycan-associated protein